MGAKQASSLFQSPENHSLVFCKSENAHQFGMMLFRKQAPMKSRFTILAALLLVNAIAYQVNDKLSFTPPFDAFDSQGLF